MPKPSGMSGFYTQDTRPAPIRPSGTTPGVIQAPPMPGNAGPYGGIMGGQPTTPPVIQAPAVPGNAGPYGGIMAGQTPATPPVIQAPPMPGNAGPYGGIMAGQTSANPMSPMMNQNRSMGQMGASPSYGNWLTQQMGGMRQNPQALASALRLYGS